MREVEKNINTALGKYKADLVLKNAFIINVFTQTIEVNDIAINNDTIVGIGEYEGIKEIDCTGSYVSPSFIDSHVHIESSMVTPQIFSDIVMSKGTTTVISDPHEIANVLGSSGIELMINSSKKGAVDIFFMIPSCVPATPFEDNGADMNLDEMKGLCSNKMVIGLGELMDVPSIINCSREKIEKVLMFKNKKIDGHCPGTVGKILNAYLNSGVSTDHECITHEEASEKVRKGMYVMLREGSAARNIKALLPAVNRQNFHRFLFCTDDRHLHDLTEKGGINECIRLSVAEGIDSIMAYTIATYNAAQCYGLSDRGAVAANYKADLVIIDDLVSVQVKAVIKNGIIQEKKRHKYQETFIPSVKIEKFCANDFILKAEGKNLNVIGIIPGSIQSRKIGMEALIEEGVVKTVGNGKVNKISAIERHKGSGKKSIGFIDGLNLKRCAIAQTIAHDSHNIIVVGECDKDMATAVNCLAEINGGIAIASDGIIIECLPLPIGGLMSSASPSYISKKLKRLRSIARSFGVDKNIDPFLTLAFMSLPVIPEIKITPRGLFDYEKFEFIDLFY